MTWSITRIVVVIKCLSDPAPVQVMDVERTVGTFLSAGCMREKCFVLHCLSSPEMLSLCSSRSRQQNTRGVKSLV